MSGSGRHFPHLADAEDVQRWATDRVEARTEFPRVIRQLIRQTNDQVVVLEMRAGKGGGSPGYDGRVEATRATPFVPAGKSVWELGVGGDSPASKANKDYRLRTKDPLGVDPSETTFVVVSGQRYGDKVKWEQEKRQDGIWREVRFFDADDIEAALEEAPGIHYRLSELVGKPVGGIQTVENWRERFSAISTPPLSEKLVLAGRADQAAALLRILEEDHRFTTISAASTDEVLAFVAATLFSTPEPIMSDLLGKALIVRDAQSLRFLDETTDLLIILPYEEELRRDARLIRSHHVVLLATADVPGDIKLPPIDRDAFAAELRDQGVPDDAAPQLAQAAHRSMVAFQYATAQAGAPARDWSGPLASRVGRRAWLAGSWNEARSGDTDVLAALFGKSYDEARPELDPVATGEDPLFVIVGGAWSLVAAKEVWRYGMPTVNALDLAAIETAIQTVLGAVDPALELPVADRWQAGIYGKTRVHSSDLRNGLATTLALAGSEGSAKLLAGPSTVSDWAASVVAQLLMRANDDSSGQLWASLSDVLPLLAEAAPDIVLSAVETGVAGDEPVLATMFTDAGDPFFVSSPHTGLLWALERVSWSSEHAALSARLLARLAEIDPGGRLSNRPLVSLQGFFRPWLPQTSLGPDRRLKVLDGLRRDHDDVAWSLMLGSLPEFHAVGGYANAPLFRSWKPETEGVTNKEYWDFTSAVATRLIEAADADPARWSVLAERLTDFPPPERETALSRLADLATANTFEGPQRDELWEKIDAEVRKHRTFAQADWALPPTEVDQLAEVAETLKPTDPVEANRWLFEDHLPDLGDEREDYAARTAKVEAARTAAAIEIIGARGTDGLVELARAVKYPPMAGAAAASTTPTAERDQWAVGLLDDPHQPLALFAAGYIYARVQAQGWTWITDHLEIVAGRPLAQARLLQQSNDLERAWETAEQLGSQVAADYWEEFSILGRGHDFTLVNEVAENLLQHDRPLAAIDLLASYADPNTKRVSVELALTALDALVILEADHHEPQRLSDYELERLLDYARAEPDVDEDRLARLEWALLPARGHRPASPALERRLARDPAFFVEIISICFKPKEREPETQMSPELATNAYRLLSQWRIVPGSSEPYGAIDEGALTEWVEAARQRLADAHRLEVGDIQIGHVFAHSVADSDGSWPARPIRNLIEKVASPRIEQGLVTQTNNNRGITSRSPADGGGQERQLAAHYAELSALIRDEWPRTAAALTTIARGYEHEAAWHDEQAERFRQGMER